MRRTVLHIIVMMLAIVDVTYLVPTASAEVSNIETVPRYRQRQRKRLAPQDVGQSSRRTARQQEVPCGGYIFDDESDRPKNLFEKMLVVVGGLASLGRKISLLAGLVVIGSGVMQYNNYLANPLQTRLLYAITTIFAGVALVFLGFLSVGHVEAVLW